MNNLKVDNSALINFLKLLGTYYKNNNEVYRAQTFLKAADTIKNLNTQIISSDQLNGIRGIGPSVLSEVTEFLATGTSKRLHELEQTYGQDKNQILDQLQKIHGIGPVKANEFYDLGVRKIEDLNQFYNQLTDAQKLSLYYYKETSERIPRPEIDQYKNLLIIIFQPYNLEWEIAGSYRRGNSNSGDIDVIVKAKPGITTTIILNLLIQAQLILGVLAHGEHKLLLISRLAANYKARRLDVLLMDSANYIFGLFYFTGSDCFNKDIRRLAESQGYQINEYGIKYRGTENYVSQPFNSEADIFAFFMANYLSPVERNFTECQIK